MQHADIARSAPVLLPDHGPSVGGVGQRHDGSGTARLEIPRPQPVVVRGLVAFPNDARRAVETHVNGHPWRFRKPFKQQIARRINGDDSAAVGDDESGLNTQWMQRFDVGWRASYCRVRPLVGHFTGFPIDQMHRGVGIICQRDDSVGIGELGAAGQSRPVLQFAAGSIRADQGAGSVRFGRQRNDDLG